MSDGFNPLRIIAISAVVLVIVIFIGKVILPPILEPTATTTLEPTATTTLEPTATTTLEPTATTTPTPAMDTEIQKQLEIILREQVSSYDEGAQQKLVDRYHILRDRADRERLTMQSPCMVAERAYQVGKFLLAKDAWEGCYLGGYSGNKEILDPYVRTLRNLGLNWARYATEERTRYKGRSYLVLCVRLVEAYDLRVAECRADLSVLVPEGEGAWPSAAVSPFMGDELRPRNPPYRG